MQKNTNTTRQMFTHKPRHPPIICPQPIPHVPNRITSGNPCGWRRGRCGADLRDEWVNNIGSYRGFLALILIQMFTLREMKG
jgi:hypothetical protein